MRISSLLFAILTMSITASLRADTSAVRVLMWDEQQPEQKTVYGDKFLGETIAAHLSSLPGITVKNASLDTPSQGLDDATLDATDVVIWWAHKKCLLVDDAGAQRVAERVRAGKLAFIALHSAHWAKPFVLLMQQRAKTDALAQVPEAERATAKWEYLNETPINVPVTTDSPLTPSLTHEGNIWRLTLPQCVFPSWRHDGLPSHVTTLLPQHPIAAGLPEHWDVAQTEMYNEPFHIPPPDSVIFEEHWDKGEHFRTGCLWHVDKGRVFYFSPGHEIYPIYHQAEPLRVLENAVRWLAKPEK